MASGSRDASVKLWDTQTGACVRTFLGHVAAVRCVQYNGRLVVSVAYDFIIRVWSAHTGEQVHQLVSHTNRIYSLLLWPCSEHPEPSACTTCTTNRAGRVNEQSEHRNDREMIISGSLDTQVKVWDLNSGELYLTLCGHTSLTSSMEVVQNGSKLITANADQTIRIWDLFDGRCLNTLAPPQNKHSSALTCIQVTKKYIVSASDDGTVKLWDLQTGAFLRDLLRCIFLFILLVFLSATFHFLDYIEFQIHV